MTETVKRSNILPFACQKQVINRFIMVMFFLFVPWMTSQLSVRQIDPKDSLFTIYVSHDVNNQSFVLTVTIFYDKQDI